MIKHINWSFSYLEFFRIKTTMILHPLLPVLRKGESPGSALLWQGVELALQAEGPARKTPLLCPGQEGVVKNVDVLEAVLAWCMTSRVTLTAAGPR